MLETVFIKVFCERKTKDSAIPTNQPTNHTPSFYPFKKHHAIQNFCVKSQRWLLLMSYRNIFNTVIIMIMFCLTYLSVSKWIRKRECFRQINSTQLVFIRIYGNQCFWAQYYLIQCSFNRSTKPILYLDKSNCYQYI